MSRQGKHRDDKVSIGIYVDEDFRALVALVVDQSGETATDILMDGVRNKATQLGILKDGVIAPEFIPAIELLKATYAERKAARKVGKTNRKDIQK